MKRFKNAVERTHLAIEAEKRELIHSDNESDSEDVYQKSHFLHDAFGGDEVHLWLDLFTKYPSLQNVSGLHIKLDHASNEWIGRFLEQGGLESILEMLYSWSYVRFNMLQNHEHLHFDDAVVMLACVGCLRSVMRNNKGLEYFCNECHIDVTKRLLLSKFLLYISIQNFVFYLLVWSVSSVGRVFDPGLRLNLTYE